MPPPHFGVYFWVIWPRGRNTLFYESKFFKFIFYNPPPLKIPRNDTNTVHRIIVEFYKQMRMTSDYRSIGLLSIFDIDKRMQGEGT